MARPTALDCAWRKGAASKERGDMDDLGERCQIAAGDWRTFRRTGLCGGGPADSANPVRAQRTGKVQSHHRNVKCLDVTPIPIPEKLATLLELASATREIGIDTLCRRLANWRSR
jgi:hypothetical protein